jgi:hypothetical protein
LLHLPFSSFFSVPAISTSMRLWSREKVKHGTCQCQGRDGRGANGKRAERWWMGQAIPGTAISPGYDRSKGWF